MTDQSTNSPRIRKNNSLQLSADPESDNVFPLSPSVLQDVVVGRNDATEALDGRAAITSPWYLQKFRKTQKVKGRDDDDYMNVINLDLTSEITSKTERETDEEFREKVSNPLSRCFFHSGDLPLFKRAIEEFDSLVLEIIKDVNEFRAAIQNHRGHTQMGPLNPVEEKNNENLVDTIREEIQKAQINLRNPRNLIGIPSCATTPALLSMAFRLKDISLRFLAAAEKYKLISETYVTETINKKADGLVLFNYILRFGVWSSRDLTAIYLNYKLKRSFEGSPFTSEIHQLLKYLKPETWQDLERKHIYITVLFGSVARKNTPEQSIHVTTLGKSFWKLTSLQLSDSQPGKKDILDHEMVELFLKDLFTFIFTQSQPQLYDNVTKITTLIDLKITHNILSFLVDYKFASSKVMSRIQNSPSYQQIQSFDIGVVTLTNVLKTAYAGYVDALNKIALDSEAFKQCLRNTSCNYFHVYLMDLELVQGETLCSKLQGGGRTRPSKEYLHSDDRIFENINFSPSFHSIRVLMVKKGWDFLVDYEKCDRVAQSQDHSDHHLISWKSEVEKLFNVSPKGDYVPQVQHRKRNGFERERDYNNNKQQQSELLRIPPEVNSSHFEATTASWGPECFS